MLNPEEKKEIEDDGRKNSEILSERVRITSLAIMGLSWTFIIANVTLNTQGGAGLIDTKNLLTPIFFSASALFSDFLQYMLNQFSIDLILNVLNHFLLTIGKIFKLMARVAFFLKIVLTFVAAIGLIFILKAVI